MDVSMRRVKHALLAACVVVSLGATATAGADEEANCCYPGSVIYYDEVGAVVGVRMYGCGDPGWGVVTRRSRAVNGCVM
ncbi:DUF6289 family protein [Luteimonas sp. SDU82]|uniref:DUF6289 family protein n=1 Tax=Luteimonas sp. SDU82 TaxID=3422592 RepID=UPI003EBE41E7